VQAPEEKGSHDDMCDAVAIATFLAQEWLEKEGRLKWDPTGQSIITQKQMSKPAQPMLSLEGISLRDLQVSERVRKNQQNVGFGGLVGVANPFHRRR
jgi:hypothetical protein